MSAYLDQFCAKDVESVTDDNELPDDETTFKIF